MDYSNSVFSCEANCREDVKKEALYRELGVEAARLKDKPLLGHIIDSLRKD
jgi:hypothetical protein